MVRVKICGIKSVGDARKAVEYGADAIGLLVGKVHASDDFISNELARKIVVSLPPFCSSVMVTHLKDAERIIELVKYLGVNAIQLHGGSTLEDIVKIERSLSNVKIYRAFHVTDEGVLDEVMKYEDSIDAVLLDSINPMTDQIGGTGIVHDWKLSRKIVIKTNKPVILAGGLNHLNVTIAINEVMPFAVDANSGVKDNQGMKNYDKLKTFILTAKQVIV